MDTSETYVKMCMKAEEIQANHEFEKFDLYFRGRPHDWQFILVCQGPLRPTKVKLLWMPRQDQLQAMVKDKLEANNVGDLHQYLNIFVEWFTSRVGDYRIREVATYEQLWLAFVIHELYGKVWDGKDWIKDA
jgi:hypothetical protein